MLGMTRAGKPLEAARGLCLKSTGGCFFLGGLVRVAFLLMKGTSFFLSFLLSSLELSDTSVYEP